MRRVLNGRCLAVAKIPDPRLADKSSVISRLVGKLDQFAGIGGKRGPTEIRLWVGVGDWRE